MEKYILKDIKDKIVFLSGPRQVGKTTLSKQLINSYTYLNFDSTTDRKIIKAEEWTIDAQLIIFDELHKMKKWKSYAKRWRSTHIDTIVREDLIDLERVRDIKSIEILIDLTLFNIRNIIFDNEEQ